MDKTAPPPPPPPPSQSFSLCWDGYQSGVTSAFDALRRSEEFTDVTLCCDGRQLPAHRILLSACSDYFRAVLKTHQSCPHLVLFVKDTAPADLEALLEYMYRGSVSLPQNQLQSFIKTAEALQIRGLYGQENSLRLGFPTHAQRYPTIASQLSQPPKQPAKDTTSATTAQRYRTAPSQLSQPPQLPAKDTISPTTTAPQPQPLASSWPSVRPPQSSSSSAASHINGALQRHVSSLPHPQSVNPVQFPAAPNPQINVGRLPSVNPVAQVGHAPIPTMPTPTFSQSLNPDQFPAAPIPHINIGRMPSVNPPAQIGHVPMLTVPTSTLSQFESGFPPGWNGRLPFPPFALFAHAQKLTSEPGGGNVSASEQPTHDQSQKKRAVGKKPMRDRKGKFKSKPKSRAGVKGAPPAQENVGSIDSHTQQQSAKKLKHSRDDSPSEESKSRRTSRDEEEDAPPIEEMSDEDVKSDAQDQETAGNELNPIIEKVTGGATTLNDERLNLDEDPVYDDEVNHDDDVTHDDDDVCNDDDDITDYEDADDADGDLDFESELEYVSRLHEEMNAAEAGVVMHTEEKAETAVVMEVGVSDETAAADVKTGEQDGNKPNAAASESKSGLKCRTCGRKYKRKDTLRAHMKVHRGLTKCRVCEKVLGSLSDLRRHLVAVHWYTPGEAISETKQSPEV